MNIFVHARSSPSAQTGISVGCYSEAGVVRCAPSMHSSMSKYYEVPSLVLVVTPTVMHITCKAARHAPILKLYSTTKASQHQTPQQQTFSSEPIAVKLATYLGAVQNAAVATLQFRASRDASHQAQAYTRMWLVLSSGVVRQAQEAIHKLLNLRWEENPSNTRTLIDFISQRSWKASRKQQESTTLTSGDWYPHEFLFQTSSSSRWWKTSLVMKNISLGS